MREKEGQGERENENEEMERRRWREGGYSAGAVSSGPPTYIYLHWLSFRPFSSLSTTSFSPFASSLSPFSSCILFSPIPRATSRFPLSLFSPPTFVAFHYHRFYPFATTAFATRLFPVFHLLLTPSVSAVAATRRLTDHPLQPLLHSRRSSFLFSSLLFLAPSILFLSSLFYIPLLFPPTPRTCILLQTSTFSISISSILVCGMLWKKQTYVARLTYLWTELYRGDQHFSKIDFLLFTWPCRWTRANGPFTLT